MLFCFVDVVHYNSQKVAEKNTFDTVTNIENSDNFQKNYQRNETKNNLVLDEEGPISPPKNKYLPFVHLFWVFLCLCFMIAIIFDLVIGEEVVIVPSIIKIINDICSIFLTYKGITLAILYLIVVIFIFYIALIVKKRQKINENAVVNN